MTHEYTVTSVTAERVAMSHFETTSRASHWLLVVQLDQLPDGLAPHWKLMLMRSSSELVWSTLYAEAVERRAESRSAGYAAWRSLLNPYLARVSGSSPEL